jgi:nicotinamide phosphoribosyltransferase
MNNNVLLLSDSYKCSHWKQYPPETTNVYSYFESRGGLFPQTVFFGLQYFLKRYLQGKVVTCDKISEAASVFKDHFQDGTIFNFHGWNHVLDRHEGNLPVRIKAVPEGLIIPTGNVLMTIENTCSDCYWVTNYLETLLVETWYPTTVATQSYYIKRMIKKFLVETGDPSLVDFKLHDFGFRGVSSPESAAIGGLAHLVNFKGTDTAAALVAAKEYYNENHAGFSIPAAEHSTMTAWGKEHEADAFRNMLKQFPTGYVAVVSDSYNIFNACENLWGDQLRREVLFRDGVLAIRADSGDPTHVVDRVLELLAKSFGYRTNPKGFKVLDSHVRVIQSDGINYASIRAILQHMKELGWSTDNIAFGMGGALLQ